MLAGTGGGSVAAAEQSLSANCHLHTVLPRLKPACSQAREADLLQQLASLQACIKPKYLSKARMRAAQHKSAIQGGASPAATPAASPAVSPNLKSTLPAQSPRSSNSSSEAALPAGWTVQQPR